MNLSRPLFVLSLTLLASLALAQNGQPDAPPQEPIRTFQVVLLSHKTHDLHYRNGSNETTLLPPTRTRTPIEYRFEDASPIRFFDRVVGPEGEMIERTLAEVPFRSAMRDMLILLHPADDSWQRVRYFLLDDAIDAFPGNSVRVLNASQYDLACEIDANQKMIEPNQDVLVDVTGQHNRVSWRIAAKIDNEWRLVRASTSQFLQGMRQIIVVNVDVSTGRPALDIFSLTDRPRAVK